MNFYHLYILKMLICCFYVWYFSTCLMIAFSAPAPAEENFSLGHRRLDRPEVPLSIRYTRPGYDIHSLPWKMAHF